MKKSVLESLVKYFNGEADKVNVDELRAEITAEYDHITEKARGNAEKYEGAREVVLNALSPETPKTDLEIFEAVKDELPDGFSRSKLRYGLLNYWADSVKKIDNGKNPNTYLKIA